MKWEMNTEKPIIKKSKFSSRKIGGKDYNYQSQRRKIEDNQFNRISRDILRKSSKEDQFDLQIKAGIFNSLSQSDRKKISFYTPNYLHEDNSNPLYNHQILSVKIKENNDNRCQDKIIFKTDGNTISPDHDTVIPTIAESNSSDYNQSFDSPLGNMNPLTADNNQYTPPKYTKAKIISMNSELCLKSSGNERFLPERLHNNKTWNMSLSLKKPNMPSFIDISPLKDLELEKSYQIRRYRHLRNYRFSTNPKVRDRAGKIILHWWKRVKLGFNKIIKIQSYWRGYRFQKHLYRIISVSLYYQTFSDKIYKVIRGYSYRNYFSSLYLRRKALFIKIMKIKLKQYFNLWERKSKRSLLIHDVAIRLFILRNRHYHIIKSLKAYYHIWVLNIQHNTILDRKNRELLEQKNKFISLNHLLNGLNYLLNRKCLQIIKPPLTLYLTNKTKERSIKIVFKNSNRINRVLLNQTFKKWKTSNILSLYLSLLEYVKMKSLSYLIQQKRKSEFKSSFDYLKKGLIEDLSLKLKQINTKVIIPTAINHLCLFSKMKGIQSVKKLLRNNKFGRIIINNLQKQQKRYSIHKYSKIVLKTRNDEKLKWFLLKHFILSRYDKSNILLRYLCKWKTIYYIKEKSLDTCRNIGIIVKTLNKYISKSVINPKKIFYHKIEKAVHNNTKTKVLFHLVGNNSQYERKKKRNILQNWYHQWKQRAINYNFNKMKGHFLQNLSKHQQLQILKFSLSKRFNHWKTINYLIKANNKYNQKAKIIEGYLILYSRKQRVIKIAMNKLMKLEITFLKGKQLLYLSKILSHSITGLRLCFNKWRSIQLKNSIENSTITLLKSSHFKQIKSIRRGTEKTKQMTYFFKCFVKWYYYSAIIYNKKLFNDFLLHLNEGIHYLNHILTVYHLQTPLYQIKHSNININNSKLLRLKNITYNIDKQILMKAWFILKHNIIHEQKIQLKGKALNKAYYLTNRRVISRILWKKFMLWRINKILFQHNAKYSMINHLEHIMIMFQLKHGFESIKKIINKKQLKELLTKIIQRHELIRNRFLRHVIIRWSLKRKLMLFNLIQKKDLFLLKQTFINMRTWTAKFRKKLLQIKEGSMLTRRIMIEANKIFWDLLKTHFSQYYSAKLLKQVLLSNSKISYDKKINQCFNHWRLNIKIKEFYDYQKSNTMKIQIRKRKKAEYKSLMKYFKKWHRIYQCYSSTIYGESLYTALINKKEYLIKSILIRNITIRPYFNIWRRKCLLMFSNDKKQFLIKRLITPKLRKVYIYHIKTYFKRWEQIQYEVELNQYKQKYLHLLISQKEKENNISIIKDFKNWQNYIQYKNINLPYNEVYSLINLLKMRLNSQVFQLIKQVSLFNLRNQKLSALFQSTLSKYFKRWRNCIKNSQIEFNVLTSFVNFVIKDKAIHQKISKTIIEPLLIILFESNTFIKNKTQIIKDYTKGITRIRYQIVILKRNIILRAKIADLNSKKELKLRLYFNIFKRNNIKMKANKCVRTIQFLYRKKLNSKYLLKRETIKSAAILINKYCQNIINSHLIDLKQKNFQLLLKTFIENKNQQKLITIIDNKLIANRIQSLRYYLNYWKNHIGLINQEDEKLFEVRSTVSNISNNKIKLIEWTKEKVTYLTLQNKHILKIMFTKYRKIIYYIIINQSCLTIQKCYRNKNIYDKEKRAYKNLHLLPRYIQQLRSNDEIENSKEQIINNILTTIINKTTIFTNSIIDCKFRKWLNNSQILLFNYHTGLIQQFLLPKVKKLRHTRLLQHLIQINRIRLSKNTQLIGKIRIINSTLQKILASYSFIKLKKNVYLLPQLKRTIMQFTNTNKVLLTYFRRYINNIKDNSLDIVFLSQNDSIGKPLMSITDIFDLHNIRIKKSFLVVLQNNVIKHHLKQLTLKYETNLNFSLSCYFTKWNEKIKGQKRIKKTDQLISNIKGKCILILKYYLITWKRKGLELYFKKQAIMIQSFLLKAKKNKTAKHNWIKLMTLYNKSINRNITIINSKRLKEIIGFKKLDRLNKNRKLMMIWLSKWNSNKNALSQSNNRLSNILTIANREINRNSQFVIRKNIYRYYIYKILSQLANIHNRHLFISNVYYFLIQLLSNRNLEIMSSFNKTKSGTHNQQIIHLTFKSIHSKKKGIFSNNSVICPLLPSFINYLQNIINETNTYCYNKIIKDSSLQIADPLNKRNVQLLIDEGIKIRLESSMNKEEEKNRLDKLITITIKHKVRIIRFSIKYILGIWHAYTRLIHIQRTQIKIMENNYNNTYTILAEELFGQGVNPNPIVLKELKELYNQMNY